MVIKINNLNKLITKLSEDKELDIMPVISNATRLVQRTAKQTVAVDTGILRTSIKTKLYPKQKSGVVFTTTEYAPYIEFGTSKMSAQPFLQPAMKSNEKDINNMLKKHIKQELQKLKK